MAASKQRRKWKIPPRIKVLEAVGAIADGRVDVVEEGAVVTSSSGGKRYHVRFDPSAMGIVSNDNASFFVGYLGYPSIAYLFSAGYLSYDGAIGSQFAGVAWKELNSEFSNDYPRVEAHLMSTRPPSEQFQIARFVDSVLDQIRALDLKRLPTAERPPSGW
jgi:hypothetical protein